MNEFLISAIEVLPLNLPLTEPFAIATGQQNEVKNVLIKILLSNGVVGLGEAAPFPAVSGETQSSAITALSRIKNKFIGADIRDWKIICEYASQLLGKEQAALCGMQMAITDALAKSYNIPLSVLFGGSAEALITDMTITSGDITHAETSAKDIINRGINTIKIKTSGKDIAFDYERIKAVRLVAPHAVITLDGNCGYTYEGAMRLSELLLKNSIAVEFFEQPFDREMWQELSLFTRNSGMKVAADESARNAKDILRIAEEKSAHIINIKLMKCGVMEAIQMVEITKAAGMELMIGGMVETILAMSFSAHFAMGTGGFQYADLDTPLFIQTHPFSGGFLLNKDVITLDKNKAGHGVSHLL